MADVQQGISIRESKRQQLKLMVPKSAKQTRTKLIYEQCQEEIKQKGGSRWFNMIYEDTKNNDETLKPIRNIFKMSRVLVDSNNKKSQNKSKAKHKNQKNIDKINGNQSNLDTNQDSGSNDNGQQGFEHSDDEYAYSESSDDSQNELGENGEDQKKKNARNQKEYKLVEVAFPPTMLKAQGKSKLKWDIIIIFFSLYQAIMIPVDLFLRPDSFSSPLIVTIDSMVDLFFVVDIIIRFRTTYIDPISGEEVMDSSMIATRYLKSSQFYIDIISTIPLKLFSKILSFLGLLKILRIQRLNSVIMNANTSQQIKAALKVIQLIIYMFLYIHIMACIWYFVVNDTEEWIPNMDFIWFGTPQVYEFYYYAQSEGKFRSYLISMYIGFYLFGVGEVCPRTQQEIIIAIPILIVSSIVNGLIIGNMALYISELNRKSQDFQRKMDTVNTAMKTLNLSNELRREVNEFFITTNSTSTLQNELNEFMKRRISQTYRILCSIQIFKSTIQTNQITKHLFRKHEPLDSGFNQDVINNIVKRMDTVLNTPEFVLCKQDDPISTENDDIYFIAKGKCKVLVRDKFTDRFEEKQVRTLEAGSHFGEIGMLYGCNRSATVISINYCTCAKINRQNYNELLQIYPLLNEIVRKNIRKYDDPLKVFLEISLNQINFFKDLSSDQKNRTSNEDAKNEWIFNMKQKQLEKGSFLYQLDTYSSEMYVIQSGVVEVYHYMKGLKGQEFLIERLYRGSIVNHNSFLLNDGIDTNARCQDTVSIYYIDIETIKQLRQKYPAFDTALENQERILVKPGVQEPALDYIIQDPYSHQQFYQNPQTGQQIHNYREEYKRRLLTVKLKNAIMQHWLEVKKSRNKPSIEEIIKDLVAKKKEESQNLSAVNEAKKKARKEKRERARREALEKQKEADSHLTSYISRDQFNYLYGQIIDINDKISEHSLAVDDLERKLLEVNKKRKIKKQRQQAGNDGSLEIQIQNL